jgi:hypothetical protein
MTLHKVNWNGKMIDFSVDRQQFEEQYFDVKARFHELLHPAVDTELRDSSPSGSGQGQTSPNASNRSLIKLPEIKLPLFSGNACNWLHFKNTLEALVINNATLSNVQKFHYLIASLQNEAKDLISNLQITNENFMVAWQLITQRYNNKRPIAIMHAQQLCHLPELKKTDAASLRQLISHFTSRLNALNAISLSVPIQDLMLNTLLLAALDPQTQRDWELITSTRRDTPSTTELVSCVEARCKAVELLQVFQSPRTNPTPTGSSSTRPANPATHKVGRHHSFSNVATQLQCTLCDESHRLFKG